MSYSDNGREREIEDLKHRVAELEKIIDHELGYSLTHPVVIEAQTVDCICAEEFEVNLENGLVCPNCGAGSDERGESHA